MTYKVVYKFHAAAFLTIYKYIFILVGFETTNI